MLPVHAGGDDLLTPVHCDGRALRPEQPESPLSS